MTGRAWCHAKHICHHWWEDECSVACDMGLHAHPVNACPSDTFDTGPLCDRCRTPLLLHNATTAGAVCDLSLAMEDLRRSLLGRWWWRWYDRRRV